MVEGLKAGSCFINNYNITPVEVPFGGFKMSGTVLSLCSFAKSNTEHHISSKSDHCGECFFIYKHCFNTPLVILVEVELNF